MCNQSHSVRSALSRRLLSIFNKIHLLALVLAVLPCASYAKTDVVIFGNGDRLTGEIKSLERGQLRFKTDATDTISIKWDKVEFISSDHNIQVEIDNGTRHLGRLSLAEEKNTVVVETGSGPKTLDTSRVVLMAPIEEKGVSRIDGDISAGYNFAKASKVTHTQLGVDLSFRSETRIIGIELDTVVVSAEDPSTGDTDLSERENLEVDYTRLRSNRWFTEADVSLERNDELGISLRRSIGAGGGRFLRQTNKNTLALHGGLQRSLEDLASIQHDVASWEAYVMLDWDWFISDSPDLDLSTSLELIPNLTDTGRVRGDFKIKLKWEMISDLFWQLEFYDSYDSKPAVTITIGEDPEKNDYGITTSLAWEF